MIKKRKKTKIYFQQVVLKKSVITTGKDGSKFPINELKKCDERAALHIKKLCHCTKQNYIWKNSGYYKNNKARTRL